MIPGSTDVFKTSGRDLTVDITLTVAVLAGGLFDVLTDQKREGSLVVAVAAIAGMAVANMWRRRFPLAFTISVMVMVLVLRTTIPNITDLSFVPIFVLVAPPYTVAAYDNRIRSAMGLVVCCATYITMSAIGSGQGTWYFAIGVGCAAWAIGRAVGTRRQLAAELNGKAQRIAQEQEELEALAVAEERTRVASELHRVIAESLSALILQSQIVQQLLGGDPQKTDDTLADIERTARVTLTEVRHILGALRKSDAGPLLEPQAKVAFGGLHP